VQWACPGPAFDGIKSVSLAACLQWLVPELTPEELASILAKLDDLMQQARELQAQIKSRMANEAKRDRPATDWSDRRNRPERRRRQRG
jgi:hypothetical protein